MPYTYTDKKIHRQRRHARTRAKISGTADRPRISVFKSNRAVMVQAVDDTSRKTLAAAHDVKMKAAKAGIPEEFKSWGAKAQRAFAAGKEIAEALKKQGIEKAVFDTGGFTYHGRVQAVAEGLRTGGISV